MYVKSLTLKGFKSFADPVTLDLQPGVNVVVGPNGSGKSNVIDAVAWVLGAQGARSLRGGKMEDVIFAGTGKRTALGRAEVSLTIDNSDRRIPMDFEEITISRTLFRSGESEYQINGVGCRLLDIQELLSDSGVGRQQHVIVSQGNLDAVLAARPEDRRMIIEEAAGVLKHRKRRERSQRRLEGTEQNLERLSDLVREVRQQMRPLEKQADAARRHGAVVDELGALRLYVAGREAARLTERQQRIENESKHLDERDEQLRREIAQADRDVASREFEAERLHGEDYVEHVERAESSYQRARGLSALAGERIRTLESELSASVTKDVIASLENDAENVRRDLVTVTAERDEMEERFAELERNEGVLANEWLAFESEWGDGLPVATTDAAEVRAEVNSLRSSRHRLASENDKLQARATSLAQVQENLNAQIAEQIARRNTLDAQQTEAASTLESLEPQLQSAAARVEETEAALRDAERSAFSTQARFDALNEALDASRARAGVERLEGLDGIAGTLLELVDIDTGYESAFEAAAGEALAAVVVDSVETARRAFEKLRSADASGAVLALGTRVPAMLIERRTGAHPLLDHVRGRRGGVDELLSILLGRAVVAEGGWSDAAEIAASDPSLTIVTKDGDRFSPEGWVAGAGGDGTTSAAVEIAERESTSAAERAGAAKASFEEAREAKRSLDKQLDQARQALRDLDSSMSRCDNQIDQARGRLQTNEADTEETAASLQEVAARLEETVAKLEEFEAKLPSLEAAEAASAERAQSWKASRAVLEEKSSLARDDRAEVERRAASLDERKTLLSKRLEQLEERLEQHREEFEQAAARRVRIEAAIETVRALRDGVDASIVRIERYLGFARDLRNRQRELRVQINERLREATQRRSRTERELMETNDKRQRFQIDHAEVRVRFEALMTSLENDLHVDLETAMNAPEPELPQGTTAKQRIGELEKDLRQMGPINPLALEELEQVQERHQFLDEQLKDIQESRRELTQVIRAVDQEIVDVFRDAFEDVSKNFDHLFAALFPGGKGKLVLTDPDNLLETGIEIEAKPSGKNVRTLSLLSGGERSMAALAFLFSIFRSRPSPFYLLDEVEAALDDMNLHRFLTLLDEFRDEAQLVVVSHQKRTMERADCLYGVSMQQGGSSKVVSERVVDLKKESKEAPAEASA